MRSRSRSPRRRHSRSREPRGSVFGRISMKDPRSLKRSRSRSPIGRRPAAKADSASRSISPKRVCSSGFERGARSEVPCKREADSTDMRHKLNKARLAGHLRPGHADNDPKQRERKSSPLDKSRRNRSEVERRHSSGKNAEEQSEKLRNEHSKHTKKSSKKHDTKAEEECHDQLKSYDQTNMMLDARFTALSRKPSKPFVPEENVSIEIERVIEGRSVPFEIPLFWSGAVVVVRRPDEGKIPLTSREEFSHHNDSEEERRTVKINANKPYKDVRPSPRNSERKKDDRQRRGELSRTASSFSRGVRPMRMEAERNILRNARDLLISMKSRDDTGSDRWPVKRSVVSASDVGRQYLLPAAAVITGELPLHAASYNNYRGQESGRFSNSSRMHGNPSSGNSVVPVADVLPDFSHRPDKYKYEEWKDRPELIPKGRSYFEHDDRDASDESWNARGFRGRGRGRGGFSRQRGGARTSFDTGVWAHDKFEEIADGQQPSSTSK